MSIDLRLVIDTGGGKPAVVADAGNYTTNVSPMWHKALLDGAGFDGGLCDLWFMPASDAIPLLEKAYEHMNATENRAAYLELNPSNGWGDFEGAKQYLAHVLVLCRKHPKCIIHSDC